jgi:hypothetical protein
LAEVSSTAFWHCPTFDELSLPPDARIVPSGSDRKMPESSSARNLSGYMIDLQGFDDVRLIGKRSFGVVEGCRNRRTGIEIAVRSFLGLSTPVLDVETLFVREADIPCRLRHAGDHFVVWLLHTNWN